MCFISPVSTLKFVKTVPKNKKLSNAKPVNKQLKIGILFSLVDYYYIYKFKYK